MGMKVVERTENKGYSFILRAFPFPPVLWYVALCFKFGALALRFCIPIPVRGAPADDFGRFFVFFAAGNFVIEFFCEFHALISEEIGVVQVVCVAGKAFECGRSDGVV